MKVTLVADSTFIFEHRGVRILTDPWIGTTIYGGAWMQFPPPVIAPQQVGRLDYIFISHIHEDHCDAATIKHLDRNATVILMERQPNLVRSFLDRNGFGFKAVVTLPPFTVYPLRDDVAIEIVDADPGHILNHLIDSSLLLHWDGGTVYFANDNPPYAASMRHLKRYRHRLCLLPASGGSGYPACFDNLTAVEKAAERARIVSMYLDQFASTIEALEPDRFMASAGNHVVSGRLADINEAMTYLWSPMTAYRHARNRLSVELRQHCVPLHLAEGDTQDLDASETGDAETLWQAATSDGDWSDRKRRFIAEVARASRYCHDSHVPPRDTAWHELFEAAGATLLRAVAATALDFRSHIYVRLPGRQGAGWGHIDGDRRRISIEAADSAKIEPYLTVACDEGLLHQLLTGAFSWNIADAAAYLRYSRVPNVYDQAAVIALNYLRQPTARIEVPTVQSAR